jgi:LysM repeat protein
MRSGQSDWDSGRDRASPIGRVADRLWPILGGLVAAAVVALTLLATLVLAAQDQILVASVGLAPTDTAPVPTATPSPLSTPSPFPTATPTPQSGGDSALQDTVSPDLLLFPTLALGERIQLLPTRQSTPTPTASPSALPSPTTVRRSSSSSAKVCRSPSGWRKYKVKRGDTLARLARLFRVSSTRLKTANCLTSNKLKVGAILWVPRVSQPAPPKQPPKPKPKPTKTPVPYGGAIVVPPELTGESPLPASNSQSRPLAVFATGLLLAILAIVRLYASQQRSASMPHGLGVYSANEQHEAV